MSDAPRMPLARAEGAAHLLMEHWAMPHATCMMAGSIRRRVHEVGDIDLVAPAPAKPSDDPLFERISDTCVKTGALFGGDTPAFTEPGDGFKPGFLACKLRVQMGGVLEGTDASVTAVIPVQVFRYTPANRGWTEIRCTGPREFGIWFLVQWKARYHIPPGEAFKASVDGHLVDSHRIVVPVASELEAFEKCGLRYIEPNLRDSFMAEQNRRRNQINQEGLR